MNSVTHSQHIKPNFSLVVKQLFCEREFRVLFQQLSFEVKNQDLIWVSGCNGAGKSSLLRALVGINTDIEGEVQWNDCSIEKSEDFRHNLLYIGHQSGVKAALTAEENLAWLLDCACRPKPSYSSTSIQQALNHLKLGPFINKPAAELSAGQKRRIALARLWLEDCALWVLDEPFTALDAEGIEQVKERIVEHVHQGGAVVFTTHQMPEFHYKLKQVHLTPSELSPINAQQDQELESGNLRCTL